ncbi:MAG: hypothetical protein DMG21_09470 [Acidobacteria bacterium]|nr:MAG: hypothetical protein DMG21_09470 [Acidobacteriota bacterium]
MLLVISGYVCSAKCALCVREPEVPVKVTVEVDDAADAMAESATCAGLATVRLMLEGEADTPAGRPDD